MSSQNLTTSMSSSDHTSDYRALHSRVNNNIEVLKSRYEAIMELLPLTIERTGPEGHVIATEKKGRTVGTSDAFAVQTHASSMVRATEDLLALTRTLKEAWLFGQIGSGFGTGSTVTDEDAKVVGEALQQLGAKQAVEN
ncbi:surfeit locus protein 5 subunit 22 of mediator complex-domain-containing protein [Geopyxis carbonaria]|nr:surfeit locus protein 5 subunit 22 of mediator complex-domain-containing protein [Geopyxis carbonaria]